MPAEPIRLGQQFGRGTVVDPDAGRTGDSQRLVRLLCNPDHGGCGAIYETTVALLRAGRRKSCGCLKRTGSLRVHGLYDHPLYQTWLAMLQRCENIDYIVTAVIRAELSDRTPDEIGRMLWRECLASVAYRYPHDKDGDRPGPVDFRDRDVDTYTWAETPELTPGGLGKTLGCYRYQSCEHPGWEGSEAEVITGKLHDGLGVSSEDWPDEDEVPRGW